jgi:drug/metabolite transporter (DMT)-like permease
MNYILLTMVVLGVTLQQVVSKIYGDKIKGGTFSFTWGTLLIALMYFVATSKGQLHFTAEFLWYSLFFGLSTCMTLIFTYLAIRVGPLSITTLVSQYSLLIPTIYGLVALGEPIKSSLVFGVLFLIISLFFINFEKKGEEKRITIKWLIYILLAFVGNGACSTIQKVQQVNCAGQYKNEFMIVAYAMSIFIMGICVLKFERKQCLGDMKRGALCIIGRGLGLAVVNFLVMILSNCMPASVMFPVISAGGTIVAVLIAVVFYKERLSLLQYLGVLLGVVSIVFLNL